MSDAARLEKLLDELVKNPGYVDGRRRFPRTVTPYDALVLTGMLHAEVDRGCEARREAARVHLRTFACSAGCNHCCEQPIAVFLPEAIRIAEWLKLPEQAQIRADFLAHYSEWRAQVGDGFERIFDAAASGDEAAHLAAHLAQWRKKVMCAFNRDGMCTIYPVRPLLCRDCHALDTNERCQAENFTGTFPEAYRHAPVERYVAHARTVDRALHHALGGSKNRKQALVQAVYELLTFEQYTAQRPDSKG